VPPVSSCNEAQLIHVWLQWMRKELGNSTNDSQLRVTSLPCLCACGRSLIPSYLKLRTKPLNLTWDLAFIFPDATQSWSVTHGLSGPLKQHWLPDQLG
jgi:hypothetical protein